MDVECPPLGLPSAEWKNDATQRPEAQLLLGPQLTNTSWWCVQSTSEVGKTQTHALFYQSINHLAHTNLACNAF